MALVSMTSEVMAFRNEMPHNLRMKNALLPLAILLPFGVFSTYVAQAHGPFGFITVSLREPWAGQMFIDLCIALFVAGTWLRRDAKTQGIAATPYLAMIPFLGSLAVLAYLVHRGLRGARAVA